MQRFNAARGFVGGATKKILTGEVVDLWFQCRTRLCGWCNTLYDNEGKVVRVSFNAARGFVGGATDQALGYDPPVRSFNAARGFVGGATRI